MDRQNPNPARQQPHLHHVPPPPPPSQVPHRSANSTPVSSPGVFSPTNPRTAMTFPSHAASEGTTPAALASHSPFLHPLQTHKVRETRTANVDRDYMTGRKIINNYEVIEEIGRGQHGKVKLARNLETKEFVAIKIIPRLSKHRRLGKVSAADPGQNTKREIAILKKIRHANVVALLEVIDDPELRKIYMVLEHVERGEIVWRKKGLPHICNFERRRVERETRGEKISTGEEDWAHFLERKAAIKEMKRETTKANAERPEYWSLEMGAQDDRQDAPDALHPTTSCSGSRTVSRAASRTRSSKATSRVGTPAPPDADAMALPEAEDGDMETPGPLRSNPVSSTALDGTMYGAYSEDPMLRGRSPSMADSIISHMSSVDFNAQVHDPFVDDYSYVPCFTVEQARSTFRDTVLGLEYLHYQGVVHRDIKPANLLWSKDYRVKISDFGVSYFGRPIREGEPDDAMSESEATDFDDDRELSKTVGTPAFFAPELCYTDLDKDPPKVSEQIDVWSLGVTLYCLVFARIPFLAEEEFSMFRKIATEDVYIPRRRLRPVAPYTDPTKTSLYKRVNNEPYRNDDDLLYEDVDDSLVDLLRCMLIKNPEKRIRLRDVKRHPWVTEGISNLVGWIDDTDPSRRASGRRIQVDDKEIGRAVVPLTFLEQAREVFKKAVDKVRHPRAGRTETSSRRRAASSATSSAGDGPSNAPSTPQSKETRRKSLRTEDYFATVTQLPSEHPLTHSVTASPYESPLDEISSMAAEQSPASAGGLSSGSFVGPSSDFALGGLAGRQSASQRSLPRHMHARSVSNAVLGSTHGPHEPWTVPATPLAAGTPDIASSSFRRTREMRSDVEDPSRARSMDRAGLVFPSVDKRAEPTVGLSMAYVPGSVEPPRHPRQIRSIDLGRGVDTSPLPSPQFFSSRAVSAYQHGQPKSDTNIHGKQRAAFELDERPATSHRVENVPDAKSPPSRVYNSSTPETFSRAQVQMFRRQRIAHEQAAQKAAPAAVGDEIDAAEIPCPPSPDDILLGMPSRGNSSLTAASLSSTSLGDAVQTPLTSPSEVANPSFIARPAPAKESAAPMLAFQSDPSLPALLSGASSVSADVEGDFLGNPGVVNRSTLIETSDSLTPPALPKETGLAGFPMEQQELAGQQDWDPGLAPVPLPEKLIPTPATSSSGATAQPAEEDGDDEDDSDSDEGLIMGISKKKPHVGPLGPASPLSLASHTHIARRRDTNTSIASTETAKKVTVHSD